METIFMDTENSKTNELHKFVLDLPRRLDLKSSDKCVVLQNLSVYYTWKNIRQQHKNNKLRKITQTWNNELKLVDSSYTLSDIQDHIEYIIKRHKTLPNNHAIYKNINMIYN